MTTKFTSPEGRWVQGWFPLKQKKDKDGKPKFDKEGKPEMQSFIALAVDKNNPELNAFYALYVAEARASFPQQFDAQGNLLNPNFAMKIQDGDGRDSTGKSVADKPGFAGCYIFKFATMFPPSVYARDSNNNLVQLTEPEKLVKLGYRIRVSGNLSGNGVVPGGTAKSGLYASPEMVLFVAPDVEIASGGDPNEAFGNLPSQAGLATSGVPLNSPPSDGLPGLNAQGPSLGGQGPSLGGPALGGGLALGGPQLGAGAGIGVMPQQGGGLGVMPQQQQGPQYTPTAAMQGASLEWALGPQAQGGGGWTIEALLAKGMITKNY